MSLNSDLVRDSKLDTIFRQDGITVHSFLEPGSRDGLMQRKEYWRRERRIGRGGFGQVHLQKCVKGINEGALRAVKLLDKPHKASVAKDLHSELEALAKFSHERYHSWFVQTFGWYEDSESIYIAMEYCQHGDLHTYLLKVNMISMDETKELSRQILEAVEQMHRNDFVHRDLKPGNILIRSRPPDRWRLILADFGISKRVREDHAPSTVKGTAGFMAPELLELVEASTSLSSRIDFKACDMWATGEIILQMLTGEVAFRNVRELANYCAGLHPKPSTKLGADVDSSCVYFLDSLMAVKPQDRMEALESLKHHWLSTKQYVEYTSSTLETFGGTQDTQGTDTSFVASARWTTGNASHKRRLDSQNVLSNPINHSAPGSVETTSGVLQHRHEPSMREASMDMSSWKLQGTITPVNEEVRDLRTVYEGSIQTTTTAETIEANDEIASPRFTEALEHHRPEEFGLQHDLGLLAPINDIMRPPGNHIPIPPLSLSRSNESAPDLTVALRMTRPFNKLPKPERKKELTKIHTPSKLLVAPILAPNDLAIILISSDGHAELREKRRKAWTLTHRFDVHREQGHIVSFSPDTRLLAWVEARGLIALRDMIAEVVHRFVLPDVAPVSLLNFSPGSDKMAVLTLDGAVMVFDSWTRERKWLRAAPTAAVSALEFTSSGDHLLTVDRMCHTIDAHTGHLLHSMDLPGHKRWSRSWKGTRESSLCNDGSTLIREITPRVGRTAFISLHAIHGERLDARMQLELQRVDQWMVSPDGIWLAVHSQGKRKLRLINSVDRSCRSIGDFNYTRQCTMAFSPDSSTLAVNCWTAVYIWDTATGNLRCSIAKPSRWLMISHIRPGANPSTPVLSKDGGLLVLHSRPETWLSLWDISKTRKS